MSIGAIDKEMYCVEYRSVATIRPTITAVGPLFTQYISVSIAIIDHILSEDWKVA